MKRVDGNNSKHLKGLADVIIELMVKELITELPLKSPKLIMPRNFKRNKK